MKNIFLFFLISFQSIAQSDDSYTRYELQNTPGQGFRILYYVSAIEPGASYYFNPLRKGSDHRVNAVTDMMTGQPLDWTIVTGEEAKKSGNKFANIETDYLKIKLARIISARSEYRIKIDKTYIDTASYYVEGGKIVFDRLLGIKRNAIVLPHGYELIKCNYPSQVILEQDGRIKISFINPGMSEIKFRIEARKLSAASDLTHHSIQAPSPINGIGRDKSQARIQYLIPERAAQTREIVYFLQNPETHSFRLYHDYTEVREGTDRYINIVRPGSTASKPSAKIIDTNKDLKVETLKGDVITSRELDIGEKVTAETEVVVIWFDPIIKNQSIRLRIEETYTDPKRYVLNQGEFTFDRSFGRPFNTVTLPAGWFLTGNAIPGTIDLDPEGNISITYVNAGPDEIDVLIRGRKR